MATHVELSAPMSKTEQTLLAIQRELQTKLGVSAREAALVALAGAVAAIQTGPIEGMTCNVDRQELLAVLDNLGKPSAKKARRAR